MAMEFNDLAAFVSVARAGGFRDAARISGVSASSLSIAVRRLEAKLGLRLLNRTTRSVAPTEAGERLIEKLSPLFSEMEAALDVLNGFSRQTHGHAQAERAVERRADRVADAHRAVFEGLS